MAENSQVAMVNMELPSVVPWWGGRNRWHRQIHVFGSVLHQSIFFLHGPIFHHKLADISSSNWPYQFSIISLYPQPLSLFLYHLNFFSIDSIKLQSDAWCRHYLHYYLLMLICPSLCLYHHPHPSLFVLHSIIFSNPVSIFLNVFTVCVFIYSPVGV